MGGVGLVLHATDGELAALQLGERFDVAALASATPTQSARTMSNGCLRRAQRPRGAHSSDGVVNTATRDEVIRVADQTSSWVNPAVKRQSACCGQIVYDVLASLALLCDFQRLARLPGVVGLAFALKINGIGELTAAATFCTSADGVTTKPGSGPSLPGARSSGNAVLRV